MSVGLWEHHGTPTGRHFSSLFADEECDAQDHHSANQQVSQG